MPSTILLPVSGTSADADVFAAALATARMFDSHLMGLHVRPDVRQDIAALAASDGGMTAGIDTLMERMQADADTREKAASDAWNAFCQQNGLTAADRPGTAGVTAEWASENGTEADWVAEYGRTVDLIVVGRGEEQWGPDYALMEAALMDTGKPVIIAPRHKADAPSAPPSSVIGIAWKDTREAAGAVAAAMPFIAKASQVTIFVVPEDDDDSDKSPARLAHTLRWHNANVSVQLLKGQDGSAVEMLLNAAARANCGLLVMGGYGHTRLREAVFGGFTRAVLQAAPIPVLMAH